MLLWLNAKQSITWYNGNDWETIECSLVDGQWQGQTASGAVITVNVAEAEIADMPEMQSRYTCSISIVPKEGEMVAGFQLHMPVAETLECTWQPYLAPLSDMTIGDKAFRSPAMVFEDEDQICALIPNLEQLQSERTIPHIMDYSLENHSMYYGICNYEETGHVYYKLTPKPHYIDRPIELSFTLVSFKKKEKEMRDFRPVEQYIWKAFAKENMNLQQSPKEIVSSLQHYPKYTYDWAFERWKDVVWQEFELDGKEVGGVVFIATAKQKPGLGQEEVWREPKSIWNQAWFCSLRTAYGYHLAGQQFNRPDWIDKANKALEFALSAPQKNGLFPGYYQAGEDNKWESGRWYMSGPRRPEGHEDYVHLLDASWTCYWMLKWYQDIEQDERILQYVNQYVEQLLKLQQPEGNFPAWVNPDTLKMSPYLMESPETSMHAMLLCLLHEIDPQPAQGLVQSAEKAAAYVAKHIVPFGRWEDFETYWSCAKQWEGKQYGVKDKRSGLYHQCTFGMYWTVEAFKSVYLQTGNENWLRLGEQVLAELSLYQQIWEPHFFPVPTLGGFGVMNSDDEWNDARQSLFALTYYDYYTLTKNEAYLARSMWAMRASFYMMYCPENEAVKALYEKVHPHFNEQDYGFHMENFNHHDGTEQNGLGEFTIFDWGNGAASSAWMELSRKLEQVN